MANVEVKNQTSSQTSNQQASKQVSESERGAVQRHQGGTSLSRQRDFDPFGGFMTPADLFSQNPFALMRRMSEEMDRTFGQFFGQSSGGGHWYPPVEVTEQNGELHVHAELPGLKPQDVKVEITDDALVIRGERKSEHEHHIGKTYRSERRYGEFYREFALPEGASADQAKAQFKDGILEVTVPVPQQTSRRREIPIGGGEPKSASWASPGLTGERLTGESTRSSGTSQTGNGGKK